MNDDTINEMIINCPVCHVEGKSKINNERNRNTSFW